MLRNTIGCLFGVLGIILWFQPMTYVSYMGMDMYQAGNHIGGIAYVVLACTFAYALLSWTPLHVPRVIVAALALVVCLLLLLQINQQLGWGLFALTVINAVSVGVAIWDTITTRKA